MQSMTISPVRRQPRGNPAGGRFAASGKSDAVVDLAVDVEAAIAECESEIALLGLEGDAANEAIGSAAARALRLVVRRRFPTAAVIEVLSGEAPMNSAVPAEVRDTTGSRLWVPDEADDIWREFCQFTEQTRLAKHLFETIEGREPSWNIYL